MAAKPHECKATPGVTCLWKGKMPDEVRTLRERKAAHFKVRYRNADGGEGAARFSTLEQAKDHQAHQRLSPAEAQSRAVRSLTVQQVMDAWLEVKLDKEPSTITAYRLDAKGVTETFGMRLASSLTEHEIHVWSQRPTPGVSMRRRQLVALKAAVKKARRAKLLATNEIEDVPLPRQKKGLPEALNWDELEDLAVAAGDSAALVMLLGTCGLRLEEAIALDQDSVDRRRRMLIVNKSKTAAGVRNVPISSHVLAMLPTSPGPLFRGPRGARLNGHNWRVRLFEPTAQEVLKRHLTPHKLRHTAATLAIESGADAVKVANMLGHKDPSVTYKIYAHLLNRDLIKVADRMDEARSDARASRHLRLVDHEAI